MHKVNRLQRVKPKDMSPIVWAGLSMAKGLDLIGEFYDVELGTEEQTVATMFDRGFHDSPTLRDVVRSAIDAAQMEERDLPKWLPEFDTGRDLAFSTLYKTSDKEPYWLVLRRREGTWYLAALLEPQIIPTSKGRRS